MDRAREAGTAATPWDVGELRQLGLALRELRDDLSQTEQAFGPALAEVHPTFQQSARNLVHYIALRRHDIRPLQERLARLGLSSLGRTETHVLAGVDAVLCILERLVGGGEAAPRVSSGIGLEQGNALLTEHSEALLGPRPARRAVRIMVTMPSEAARDYETKKSPRLRRLRLSAIAAGQPRGAGAQPLGASA